jgi:hypothetical protein
MVITLVATSLSFYLFELTEEFKQWSGTAAFCACFLTFYVCLIFFSLLHLLLRKECCAAEDDPSTCVHTQLSLDKVRAFVFCIVPSVLWNSLARRNMACCKLYPRRYPALDYLLCMVHFRNIRRNTSSFYQNQQIKTSVWKRVVHTVYPLHVSAIHMATFREVQYKE